MPETGEKGETEQEACPEGQVSKRRKRRLAASTLGNSRRITGVVFKL